jgi:hypothetical protein
MQREPLLELGIALKPYVIRRLKSIIKGMPDLMELFVNLKSVVHFVFISGWSFVRTIY